MNITSSETKRSCLYPSGDIHIINTSDYVVYVILSFMSLCRLCEPGLTLSSVSCRVLIFSWL